MGVLSNGLGTHPMRAGVLGFTPVGIMDSAALINRALLNRPAVELNDSERNVRSSDQGRLSDRAS